MALNFLVRSSDTNIFYPSCPHKLNSKMADNTQVDETNVAVNDGQPEEYRKYKTYDLKVDYDQDDKATEIKLCSFARPHMRAFHLSWWCFFIAFFIWFAIAPLLSEIRDTLGLTNKQIWTSSITAVAGDVGTRFLLGPLCDKYGARVLFTIILCAASIPTACTGLVQTATGLAVLRLFIGIAGGCFVMCQYWSSRMFVKELVGTANALVGGWGNLGGGVTQLVMGSALFPLFTYLFDGNTEKAWRTVSIVPACLAFSTGVIVFFISDDAPKGNYKELKKQGVMPEVSAVASFRSGAINLNAWILFIQYAACFGVELTMNNAAALYFTDQFNQSTASAAAIASIFGWMNLFCRGLGGFSSDYLNKRLGMRGRLIVQTTALFLESIMIMIFAFTDNLVAAIVVLLFFSLFVQAAEGSTYGIVPYVDTKNTGAVSGIVGAGGNAGAVALGFAFRQLTYRKAYIVMSVFVFCSCFLSIFLHIKNYSGLLWGKETISLRYYKKVKSTDKEAE